MVIHLLPKKFKSDCYYQDYNLDMYLLSNPELNIFDIAKEKNITLKEFSPNYKFEKSKYDYTEDDLIELDHVDFKVNESTCEQRVMTIDGNIYFCPGFVELKEPICNIGDFDEENFNEYLEDFYFKKLHMCTSDKLEDIRRFCPVKHRCNKKMCYYLNSKITGEKRFPFSRFCAIKELRYKNKMDKENVNVLFLILNSLTKINEAILSMGTASPDFNIKNRTNQLVKEVNENITLILKKIEEDNNA